MASTSEKETAPDLAFACRTSSSQGVEQQESNSAEEQGISLDQQHAESSSSDQVPLRIVLKHAFESLGAIYGDIGTSPLYTISTIFSDRTPTEEEVMGAMSAIFWTFSIVVILKYLLIVLTLGPNNGEGGQVAIYAKLARTLHVGPRGVVIPGDEQPDLFLKLSKSMTRDSEISRMQVRLKGWYHQTFLPKFLLMLCFLGCSLVMSDGLLTPTTSVLSAVSGIQIAVPSIEDKVMPISVAILVVLFLIQELGTARLSYAFAPICVIWFALIAVCGVINIVKHPAVLRAFNPALAVKFFHSRSNVSVFGSVMLSVTGVEAMFADIGHFGRKSVQLALFCVVYPSLMLAYLGQTAYIVRYPDSIANAFYYSIPGGVNSGLYWVIFVVAIVATIIASQALILGVFSIFAQLIRIDCFPAFHIRHTSKTVRGQVYIPVLNYLLMIGVILTTVGFKTSNAVTAAYGLGISLDFIVTTTLITFCMIYVFHFGWYIWVPFFLLFAALDMCFIIAGFEKVPHGAWFPLAVSVLVCCFITFWRWARSLKVDVEYGSRIRINDLFGNGRRSRKSPEVFALSTSQTNQQLGEGQEDLDAVCEKTETGRPDDFENEDSNANLRLRLPEQVIARLSNTAVFIHVDSSLSINHPNSIPSVFSKILHVFPGLPEHVVFLGVQTTDTPYIDEQYRIAFRPLLPAQGLYRCIVRFGFMETVDVDDKIVGQIFNLIGTRPEILTRVHHVMENDTILAKRHHSAKSVKGLLEIMRAVPLEWIFGPLERLIGRQRYIKVPYGTNLGANIERMRAEDVQGGFQVLYIGTVLRI
ncbi:potassium transporter-domain-containing protein [Lipomyces oligophaga]|uniref:potassium transporter-domain-containing protein n=1 Tax=Lipomyces oligophaga TaxID=45792 RepID=UPI0034CFDFDD